MAGSGKPVPSSDLRDLEPNANTLDEVINSEDVTTVARETPTNPSGKTLKTITGFQLEADNAIQAIQSGGQDAITSFESQAQETLNNLGLEYPPIAYTAGLTVERSTQTYTFNNVIYINTRTDKPFTTTGSFDEGGWQIVQQINQSTVIFTSDGIKGLEDVALIDRASYSVSGFYAGTEVGGGQFIYDASRDKADHNGGTVITPEAIAAWDGTQANLSVLLDWSGTGTGAFVRIHSIPMATPEIHVDWFGAIADGFITDNNVAFQGANDAAGDVGSVVIKFGQGEYLTSHGLTGPAQYLEWVGVESSVNRHYDMPTKIKFSDDGTTTDNRVGMAFNGVWALRYIQASTLSSDSRGVSGNFTGFTGEGRNHTIDSCIIEGFPFGVDTSDCGYAYHTNLIWRFNKEGYKYHLSAWTQGTTLRVNGMFSFQNDRCYNVPNLTSSTFNDLIVEVTGIGIFDFGSGNTFSNVYGENNYEYTAYSEKAADAVLINPTLAGANSDIVIAGNVSGFGFDRIGETFVDDSTVRSRVLSTYDQSGNIGDSIKGSSTGNSLGRFEQIDKNGNSLGYLIPSNSAQIGKIGGARSVYNILIHNDLGVSVLGGPLPSSWTVTKVSTGVWDIDFNENIRPPFTQITVMPTTALGSGDVSYQLKMKENGAGNWNGFQNASGFRLELRAGGVANDNCASFVQIWA